MKNIFDDNNWNISNDNTGEIYSEPFKVIKKNFGPFEVVLKYYYEKKDVDIISITVVSKKFLSIDQEFKNSKRQKDWGDELLTEDDQE